MESKEGGGIRSVRMYLCLKVGGNIGGFTPMPGGGERDLNQMIRMDGRSLVGSGFGSHERTNIRDNSSL